MSGRSKLAQMHALTEAVLEARLARLKAAAAARDASLAQLDDLSRPDTLADADPIQAALARLAYDRWAEGRRAEINLVLARQTAEWLQARAEARLAFGRSDVLRRLSEHAKR